MTIVLISPRKLRKTFIVAMIVAFAVILVAVLGAVFLPALTRQFGMSQQEEIPMIPQLTIDFSSLDSPQVQQLQPFLDSPKEFDYTAQDASGKEVKGAVSAVTVADAQSLLQGQGLTVKSIEEAARGRIEPFIPYYTTSAPVPIKK